MATVITKKTRDELAFGVYNEELPDVSNFYGAETTVSYKVERAQGGTSQPQWIIKFGDYYDAWARSKKPSYDRKFALTLSKSLSKFTDSRFELEHIKQTISNSRYILELEEGWDDDKAVPISKEIYDASIGFLNRYAHDILQTHDIIISAPEINPLPDGTIDISWITKTARMLINIKRHNDEIKAFFYGDLYNDKLQIKGNVPIQGDHAHLSQWMTYLAE